MLTDAVVLRDGVIRVSTRIPQCEQWLYQHVLFWRGLLWPHHLTIQWDRTHLHLPCQQTGFSRMATIFEWCPFTVLHEANGGEVLLSSSGYYSNNFVKNVYCTYKFKPPYCFSLCIYNILLHYHHSMSDYRAGADSNPCCAAQSNKHTSWFPLHLTFH